MRLVTIYGEWIKEGMNKGKKKVVLNMVKKGLLWIVIVDFIRKVLSMLCCGLERAHLRPLR